MQDSKKASILRTIKSYLRKQLEVTDMEQLLKKENHFEGVDLSAFILMIQEKRDPEQIYNKCFVQDSKQAFIESEKGNPQQETAIIFKKERQSNGEEKTNKGLCIEIRVSNEHFYVELSQMEETGGLSNVFQKAIDHMKLMNKKGALKSFFRLNKARHEILLFKSVEASTYYSGAGDGKVELLPDSFEYELLPKAIEIAALLDDPTPLIDQNIKDLALSIKIIRVNDSEYKCEKEREEKLRFNRLRRFIKHFREEPYKYITKEDVDYAIKETQAKFFGIEEFMGKFKDQLMQFTSEWYAVPKGIVLYGPPGTGKSAISGSVCNKLDMVLATAPMAAGDLKKGIVGDSEKTVNAIAMRAQLIPWELCGLLIDEIDSLVPDRNAKDASNGSQDLQGVLLATLDGSKETPNLKIIATTNLLHKIDSAFLRRMEIQLFLGNPSKSSRKEWIKAKAKRSESDKNYNRIKWFLESKEIESLKDKMIDTTINFSADAYRKLLERYFHMLLSSSKQNLTLLDYEDLMHKKIKEVSEEMKIYLGRRAIVDILKEGEHLKMYYKEDQKKLFYAYASKIYQTDSSQDFRKASKQVLVDLTSDKSKDVFQLGCLNQSKMSSVNQDAFSLLKSVYDNAFGGKIQIQINHYLFALISFQNILHRGHYKTKYEHIRLKLLEHNETKRILRDWTSNQLKDNLLVRYEDEFVQAELNYLESFVEKYKANPEALFCNLLSSIDFYYDQATSLQTFHLLSDSSKYKASWLPIILDFALAYDADVVKLIDNAFIVNNSAHEDTAALSLINDVVEEVKKYNRAVVIFDLDSISLIRKEYQSLKEDLKAASHYALEGGENVASFTYVLARPLTFLNILDLIKNVESDGSCWFFAVSEHNKLVLDLKEALKWPKTQSVLDYEEEEKEKERPFRCLNCNEIFTERQNKNEYKCGKHRTDQVIFEDPRSSNSIDKKSQKVVSVRMAQEMIAKREAFPIHFKFTCCGGMLNNSKGELPCRHEQGEAFLD